MYGTLSKSVKIHKTKILMLIPENSHRRGKINVQLVSCLAKLDLTNEENILLFVCCEAIKSKLVKLFHVLRHLPEIGHLQICNEGGGTLAPLPASKHAMGVKLFDMGVETKATGRK